MPIVGSSIAGSEVAHTRARVARASKAGTPEEITEAKRDHAAAMLRAHIVKVVDEAPPLTDAQRAELAALLRGASR